MVNGSEDETLMAAKLLQSLNGGVAAKRQRRHGLVRARDKRERGQTETRAKEWKDKTKRAARRIARFAAALFPFSQCTFGALLFIYQAFSKSFFMAPRFSTLCCLCTHK